MTSPPPVHAVLFHIGTERVVCTCGADFAPPMGLSVRDAVSYYAEHVRNTAGINLQDAYEDGWRDANDDYAQQRTDPTHPIGARHQASYPTRQE